MKKIKMLIIIFCIIIFIIIISMIILNIKQKKEYKESLSTQGDKEVVGLRNIYKVDSKSVYCSVEGCIKKYFDNINNNIEEALYNILDKDYVKNNNIDVNNVVDMLKNYREKKYTIKEMYYLESSSQIPYIVRGELYDNQTIKDEFFIVVFDVRNETYSIEICNEDKYKHFKNGSIEYTEIPIEKNEYNFLKSNIYSDEDMAKKYFYDYIENVVYYPTYAYKTLNEEYSKKRFQDYEEYKDYLKNNIETFRLIEMNRAKSSSDFKTQEEYSKYFSKKYYAGLQKYQINKIDEYVQYICIDGSEKYYIFNVKDDFSYDVILDTYTLDFPQFIEKYNNSNVKERVILNIDRFFKSINDWNYRFAYSCLSEGFRDNKFKDQSEFENFIKKNLFNKNDVEFEEFKNEGETYIYNLIIKDSADESKFKNMQVIMKLKEATNFVISFNIK